ISAGSRTATIPEQVVARDGTIEVPYAGPLKVAGLTPGEVEQAVVHALEHKAIEPQAVVTITKNLSNTVSVGGEVAAGARVPLTTKGDRILDVIASAGGIRVPASDAFIRLTRGRRTVSVAYNAILAHPEENIYVVPGDDITVVRDPQTFTAFGGTGRNAQVPFDAAGITLEEAIAKAGGLLDYRADPAGVFLLRFEPTPLVEQLAPGRQLPSQGDLVPVVYRLNLKDANSFFLARSFPMRDKDMLYVANSASDPVQKFLGLIGTVTAPVVTGAAVYGAVK
ncbi:MAG: polysaccharide biosynthesis/export family protein, partial [Xanthobacteraceae bacterium]